MHPPKHSTRQSSASAPLLYLTVEDVQRLLAPETATDARLVVAERVTDHYLHKTFGDMEALLAEQLFRLLVRDTEVNVRKVMAEQLKQSPGVPHDIVLALAKDVEDSVALPVLQYSEVLTQVDLIELVETTAATARHVAISGRRTVSPELASILVDKGDETVAAALLGNAQAQLDESALASLLGRFENDSQVMDALVHRSGLPPAIVEKVVSRVSGAVAEDLRKRYRFSEQDLKDSSERARVKSTLALLGYSTSSFEINKLVDQLADNERLSPTLIFSALAQGHVRFFEASLARLSQTSVENASKLIHDRGGLGMRAIYNKAGLPPGMFGTVRQLFGVVAGLAAEGEHRTGEAFANRVCEQLLQMQEFEGPADSEEENINLTMALVRSAAH